VVLTLLEFTPISAFLSLSSVILTFTVAPSSPLPFLLLLTPLYINSHNYGLGASLVLGSLAWPTDDYSSELIVRLALVVNSLYMMSSANRTEKYKMLPGKVINEGLPILL
jgi:hypothetical protein